MTDNIPPPATVAEVADVLRVSESTVRELIRSGEIKAVQVGRAYRIPAAEVARLTGVGAA